MWFTRTGKLHIIRPQAIFKQVTGWYLDRRRPKTEAPTVCNHPKKGCYVHSKQDIVFSYLQPTNRK
jgi:hypothetical protein